MSSRHDCRTPFGALLVLAAFALHAGSAGAIVVFDNFDPGGGFHPGFFAVGARVECATQVGFRAGARFTIGGDAVTLTSITLPIVTERYLTTAHRLRVRIAADDAGLPGATIEVLSENQSVWADYPAVTAVTLASNVHPVLESGASYWIVTEPTAMSTDCNAYIAYNWHYNTTGTLVPYVQDAEAGLPSDPWNVGFNMVQAAFRVEGDAVVDIGGGGESIAWGLGVAGPMPFSRSATIQFSLPVAGPVSIAIYDLAGRRVRTLVNAVFAPGRATTTWDGRSDAGVAVASGLYIARMKSDAVAKTHKLLLAR